MENVLKVYISGPAFSLLLYENLRCPYNQEGFLLGKKYARKVSKITDHDPLVESIEWEVHINSIVPCPKLASFYNATGALHQDSLKSILNKQWDDVVGWYCFKRENVKVRLREKIVHKRLSAVFSSDVMEHFLWGVLNTISSPEKINSRQSFVRYNSILGEYMELPMLLINLSNSKHEYKASGIPSVCLNKVINALKADKTTGNLITRIEDTLQDSIAQARDDLTDSELELFQLEQEIAHLRCPPLIANVSVNEDDDFCQIVRSESSMEESQTVDDTVDEIDPSEMDVNTTTPSMRKMTENVNGVTNDSGDSCASPNEASDPLALSE